MQSLFLRPHILVAVLLSVTALSCSGPPSAGNSPGPATPAKKRYGGTLDLVGGKTIEGWAWEPSSPDKPVSVDLYDGDSLLTTVTADVFREGLRKNGKGNGRHQFTYLTPDALKDGQTHTIHAFISGTTEELNLSPKAFRAE